MPDTLDKTHFLSTGFVSFGEHYYVEFSWRAYDDYREPAESRIFDPGRELFFRLQLRIYEYLKLIAKPSLGSAQPEILPRDGDVLIIAAKACVAPGAVAQLDRLMFVHRQRRS